MKRLRWSIAALMLHLALFFNIERLDFNQDNVIDILSFVYVLGIGAVVATLIVPYFRRHTAGFSILLWIAVYFVLRRLFFNERPLIGGLYLYLSITELALLSGAILLAHRVALDLQDFEQAIINITLPQTNRRVRPISEATEDIQTEMLRSRRHKRPLSVVVVRPDPSAMEAYLHRSVREIQQAMMTRYTLTGLMRVIADTMRRTDLVIEIPNGDEIVVLSPETDTDQSSIFSQRIQSAAAQQLGIAVTCGTASFPSDALTFEELVREATRKVKEEAGNQPTFEPLNSQAVSERTTDGINTKT